MQFSDNQYGIGGRSPKVSPSLVYLVEFPPCMIISGTVLTAHAEAAGFSREAGFMLPETVHVSRPVD